MFIWEGDSAPQDNQKPLSNHKTLARTTIDIVSLEEALELYKLETIKLAFSAHVEYLGMDEEMGPIAISMVKEDLERSTENHQGAIYRMIIRISDVSLFQTKLLN